MMNTQKKTAAAKVKQCFFCVTGLKEIDFKDAQTLRKFTSSYGKIMPTKKSFLCAKHQRKLAMAIKRARIMALLPFINR